MMVTLLLIMHILADFYFQTDAIAKKKNSKASVFVCHTLVYAALMLLALLPFMFSVSLGILGGVWLLLAGSHALIDLAKRGMQRKSGQAVSGLNKRVKGAYFFFGDQVLHGICIMAAITFVSWSGWQGECGFVISATEEVLVQNALVGVLIFLFLAKPASIMVRIILGCVERDGKCEKLGVERAGTAIGILERFIIAVFTLCGQPAAIAFVIAAKSLARFKQLENQEFAERYLVGTLLSSLLALLASIGAQTFLMR